MKPATRPFETDLRKRASPTCSSAVAVVWGSLETTERGDQCDGQPHSETLPLKKAGELLGI